MKSNLQELNLSPSNNLVEAANNFYDYLHLLDNSECNMEKSRSLAMPFIGSSIIYFVFFIRSTLSPNLINNLCFNLLSKSPSH